MEVPVELEFKPDFEEASRRWTAFWKGEHTDRPLVKMVVPKEGVEPVAPPEYMAGADGNYEEAIEKVLRCAETHEFLGEAIPLFYLEFGADHFSMLLGAERRVHPDSLGTAWVEPFVEDWDDAEIAFRRDGTWWRRTVEFAQALRERLDGKLLIAAPTLVAGLDALVTVRGVNKLMMDLATSPQKVKRALDAVCAAYGEIVDALAELLDFETFGSITRHGLYCPGRINVPQCDCSCMISPEMFREFELPCLKREMAVLDAAEYHLDGPGAIQHVEALCELEDLDVIQWMPGAGEASGRDWTDLFRRIDAFGKGLYISASPEQVKHLSRELKSPKLYFNAKVGSRREAEKLLAELESGA